MSRFSCTLHLFFLAGITVCVLALFTACKKDEETYDTVNGWIYYELNEDYLFYNDVPSKSSLNFNLSPEEFLQRAASARDQKNGYVFSHIERSGSKSSGNPPAKGVTDQPSFGFEAAILRDNSDRYYFRVLYLQPNSPAAEAGLERGDWIIRINGEKLGSDAYNKYIANPTGPCSFIRGLYNGRTFKAKDTVQMPAPRRIYEQPLLKHEILNVGGKKVAYLLYNHFENDATCFENAFQEIHDSGVDHIILDLRYNPGGYVNIAQALCTYLAPQESMGKTLFKMIYSEKKGMTRSYTLDESLRMLPSAVDYAHLYIIASDNTASASELVINCLRPYMRGRLYQVGTETYGKNLAQTALNDQVAPGITLWLTTCYLANCEDFSDYFDNGLPPDIRAKENFSGVLGEFASDKDVLCAPIFQHITAGKDARTPYGARTSRSASLAYDEQSESSLQVVDFSLSHKPKEARWQ